MSGHSATHLSENRGKSKLFKEDSGFSVWNGSGGSHIDHRSAYRISDYFPDKHKERGSIYLFHDTEKCRLDSVKNA